MMTEEQGQQVRALVKEKRYDEARALLFGFPKDPTARQWLETLDNVMTRETLAPVKIRFGPGRYYLDTSRAMVYVVTGALLLLLTRSPIPIVLFILYDRLFNTGGKLDGHRIAIGLIVAIGLTYGLAALLTILRVRSWVDRSVSLSEPAAVSFRVR